MFFGIRPQTNPYLGYPGAPPQMPGQQMAAPQQGQPQQPQQMPQQAAPQMMPPQGAALQQPPQVGAQMSPMLQQLMQNPAFLARLQQMRGTGLGGMQPQMGGFAQPPGMMNTQPIAAGAQSLR